MKVEKNMEIEEIKAVMRLMSEYNVSEFKIEAEGCNLSISRNNAGAAMVPVPAPAAPAAPAMTEAVPDAPAAPAAPAAPETIDAPLVGTFYRSASPDSKPFVSVGDKVVPDSVICIIEAMKVMNEIKAEKAGVIKEILIENGQPVEFGQPLFTLE